MDTIYNLQERADTLRKKTETDSISPEEVGGLHADTLAYMADLEQNMDGLGIRKLYKTYAAMTAEDETPIGTNGKVLRYGQLVAVYDGSNATQAESGNIYAWQKGTGAAAWLLVGNLANIVDYDALIAAEASTRASADTAMDSRMTAAESKIAENAANIDSDAAQFQAKVDDLDRKIDGVIDTIELGGLDNLVTPDNAAAVAKKLTNARWTVTYDGRKVGVLEMFSDGSSHQITQMITSNYNMTVGSGSTTEHYDNEVRCYYRNYNINSPSLENKKGTWSSWAEVVPKYTRNWIESFKEYMERTVALTQAEYDALVEAGTVDEETYYNILEDE